MVGRAITVTVGNSAGSASTSAVRARTRRASRKSLHPAWMLTASGLLLFSLMGQSCSSPAAAPLNGDPGEEVLDIQPDPASPDTSTPDSSTPDASTPDPGTSAEPAAPVVAFYLNASAVVGPIPLEVTFSVTPPEGKVLPEGTYTWDFGDSATEVGTQVVHTYTAAGIYTVTVALAPASPDMQPTSASTTVVAVEALAALDADYELTEDEPFQFTLGVSAAELSTRFAVETLPLNGTLDVPAGADLTSPVITYTPAAGFVGDDELMFSASEEPTVAAARSMRCPPARIRFFVRRKGILDVSPNTGLTSTGGVGGPFAPDSASYTLKNVGARWLYWEATKSQTWLTLSKTSAWLAPGDHDTVTVTFSAEAAGLAAGEYTDTVKFFNWTNGRGNTWRQVNLTVGSVPAPGELSVTSTGGFTSSGVQGGPFSPASKVYTLSNTGGQELNWAAGKTQPWVNLSKSSGTLAAGATDTVTVSITSAANGLAAGNHADTVTFTNATNGRGNTTRSVGLTVAAPVGALSVSPSANLTCSGVQGGPFSPSSKAYTLKNTGGQSINWSVTDNKNWITRSKSSGTLAAGATDTVTVSLTSNANSLTAGSYSGTVTFTNTTNGSGNTTRTVTLTVSAPAGALAVSPSGGLSSSGTQGGPFSPASAAYTLTNSGSQALNWTAAKTQSWVSLSKSSGTLAVGATDTVTVSIGSGANSLAVGSYSDTVTFTNTTNGSGNATRSVSLSVSALAGVLAVSPSGGLSSSGDQGGPFSPSSKVYTLSNTGGQSISWTAAKTQSWVSLSKSSGTLAAGATDTVTVSIGSGANSLAAGSYSDTVTFTNTTNGSGNATRSVSLSVAALAGALAVSPSGGLSSSGSQGGPFSPSSKVYTLSNPGGQSISWTAAKTQSWVSLSKSSGTLAAGATDTVTVSIGSGANSLAAGSYSDTVTFTNSTNGSGNTTRSVDLSITALAGVLSMTPSGGLSSSGDLGGPFSPSSTSYTLSNTGNLSMSWAAAKTQSWVTLSKTSGTLAVGATDTVTVSIGAGANSLAAGSHADTVTFTNTTTGIGNSTRAVALTVIPPPGALSVSPSGGFSSSGMQGGPFTPANTVYTVINTGGQSIVWTASKTQSWVGLSKSVGTLAAGATDTITVSFTTGANSLAAGSYSDTVTFTNTTNGTGNTTRSVALTVTSLPGVLSVTPTSNLSAAGTVGGPFSPSSTVYTLTNTVGLAINWTAAKTQNWVSLSKTSGTLAAGATDTVTVSINNIADSLTLGSYSDTVTFTNSTNGSGNTTRSVELSVNVPPGILSVSPTSMLVGSGTQGGPFTPAGATYTLTNTGGQYITWSATNVQSWLSLSKSSGGLAPGATDAVVVSFNSSANSLGVNVYNDTVTFTNTTNGAGNTTRSVKLTVDAPPGALTVTRIAGLDASGPVGGTFTPASVLYTITNNGSSTISWTATKTAAWLNVSRTSGTLAAGASEGTILYFSASANLLPAGTYSDSVVFTNVTNGAGNTSRAVTLTVIALGEPEGSAAMFTPSHPVQLTPPALDEWPDGLADCSARGREDAERRTGQEFALARRARGWQYTHA